MVFPINDPYGTTSSSNGFNAYSDGVIQGLAYADAASQNYLSSGIYDPAATVALYGGLPIETDIAVSPFNPQSNGNMGGVVRLAKTIGAIGGFSVFDQAHHYLSVPGQPVPYCLPNMTAHFYRFGSNARIPVKASPQLALLDGSAIGSQVSWDFNVGQLVPFYAATQNQATTALSWTAVPATSSAPATGYVTVTTGAAHGLSSGDIATISGAAPPGYNGSFPVTVTSPTAFTYALATNPGAATAQGSIAAGGGALQGVRVLEIITVNCKTIVFNPVTGGLSYSANDAAAIILI